MKNQTTKFYALILAFLGISLIFFSKSQTTLAEFLIFLFSGILIGINIFKLKNLDKV